MKLKIKSLALALFCSLSVSAVSGQSVNDGMVQLDRDQPSKAKSTFETLVANSASAENFYYLGYYYLRTGDYAQAKVNFDKGLIANVKQPLNAVGNASILVANKQLNEAKIAFDKIIFDTKGKNIDVLFRIAEAYTMFYRLGEPSLETGNNDPGEAIRLIDMIATKTQKPLTEEQQIIKGDAFLIKNDGGPAVSAYEQALTVNPNNVKAITKIGIVYLRGKNYQETINNYNNAIKIDSNYAPVYKRLGEYYIIFSKYQLASKQFKKYASKAEASPSVIFDVARLMFLAKDYPTALEYTQKAEDQKYKDNDMYRLKGYSNVEQAKFDAGLENLNLMVKAGVKPFYLDNVYFGRAYQGLSKDSLAVDYYAKAATEDTLNNNYQTMYDLLVKMKKYRNASEVAIKSIDWKKAKKINLSSTDYANVAKNYYNTAVFIPKSDTVNRVATAKLSDEYYQKASDLLPKWPLYYYNRANVNILIDAKGDNWLSAPYYEKFITAAEYAKTDATVKYPENKENYYNACRYMVGYYAEFKKDLVNAQVNLDKALSVKPEDPDKLKEVLNPVVQVPVAPVKAAVKTTSTTTTTTTTTTTSTTSTSTKPVVKKK